MIRTLIKLKPNPPSLTHGWDTLKQRVVEVKKDEKKKKPKSKNKNKKIDTRGIFLL
jgi:hypothetical protein